MNTREEYDEFFFDSNHVGDNNATLLIRIRHRDDLSVHIQWEAQLFDEEERVASANNDFFIMRDSKKWEAESISWIFTGEDPDTADMDS